MTPAETPGTLQHLRRRVRVKTLRLRTALIDRRTPWRDCVPIIRQLATLVGPLEDCDEVQLRMLDGFLSLWLDVVPLSEGIVWPEPLDPDGE